MIKRWQELINWAMSLALVGDSQATGNNFFQAYGAIVGIKLSILIKTSYARK